MHYSHSTVKYLFANLWYIVLLSILPGICFAGMVNIDVAKEVYTMLASGQIADIVWLKLFDTVSFISFDSPLSALFSIGSLIVIILSSAMTLALIEKHMRIGKRTFNGIWGKLNDNILSTSMVALLYGAIYEVWALVFSAVSRAGIFIIDGTIVQYVYVSIVFIVTAVALLFVAAVFYLWLPCMQITGFRTFEALRYCNQLEEKERRRFMFSFFITAFFGNLIMIPAIVLLPKFAAYVVLTIVYMFLFMFFLVRMEVGYFSAAGLDREDLAA